MNSLQRHLEDIRTHQPSAWQSLKDIYESPFELEDGQIHFLGRAWDHVQAAPELNTQPVAVMLYGMGDGQLLKDLLAELPASTPLIVLDSQPELAWAYLNEGDFSAALTDPRLKWCVARPDSLVVEFAEQRLLLQDQLGFAWLENPQVTQIAGLLNDTFLKLFRHEAQALGQIDPLARVTDLEQLYATLAPDMSRAYSSYPLSCRNGCSDCCETTVGFHLCVNPLEWALLHRHLTALESSRRQEIFDRAVQSLAPRADFLVELIHYFDSQPDRLQDPAFHLELLEMANHHSHQACIFLGPDRGCQVYEGRPLTCRVFGNSHVQHRQTFTCDKDADLMERILLDEGPQNRLVNSSIYRSGLWKLHHQLEYKQVLNLWILTHLDFATRDFKPLRLDYQQFQALVRHPEILEQLLADLQSAATVSGATETAP